ncbi:uncharacterized protein SAPINGB_P002557 [Magnusiomyces paraingens]|uniref:Uncharacterized protein n=1 Tax=Magnusiomyces paraingens TaxID=2606893 RepID=A0A5E8BEJ0_9ASCO|nr:uncharacterized protein SAPINGB_P002557 [Saprochaete ingens]VVT50013.1 unnamed protein product [Saprochaete ingens]
MISPALLRCSNIPPPTPPLTPRITRSIVSLPGDTSQEDESTSSSSILSKAAESAAVMFASVAVIALAGFAYQQYYNAHALAKMERAFYPSLASCDPPDPWVERSDQALLDNIVSGQTAGRYYLLIGEKGTGKTSMLREAVRRTNGARCAFLDAHPDPEIVRLRLGHALDFAFYEDYLGAMFQLRGPRDTTALLDIERAFNKLEIVARRVNDHDKRPLVLIINNIHMVRDDESGQHLIELLQQKAEALAGMLTVIFNSDDYWVYERLKKLSTKLEVITVRDMSRTQAVQTLCGTRKKLTGQVLPQQDASDIYSLIGGRPQHLAQIAAAQDMLKACHELIDRERTWYLNQCGLLGQDMDDDVMESGKFSTSAMLLMRALVQMDSDTGSPDHVLPQVPLWTARRIMTRPDYIQRYDALNIFTIDKSSFVKADSVPMMQAFREIAAMPKFDELLEETCDRVSAIESLGRTREIVLKDLVQGGHYHWRDGKITLSAQQQEDSDENDDDSDFSKLNLDESSKKWWWHRRSQAYLGKQASK